VVQNFGDRLSALIRARGPICAGVDPRPERLPAGQDAAAWGAELGELLGGEVAALKPQLAFFGDAWAGPEGVAQAAAPGGALVIADCKRGDIGSTAEAYAARILGPESPFAAATINPYLGRDSLEPFLRVALEHGKGLFVLVRTSNPGHRDLQDLDLAGGGKVYERIATLVHELGADCVGSDGLSAVGAVVGLTAPLEVVARCRELMPHAPFLMPGYGAQGGDPAVFRAALTADGGGVLVSASRSLTHPWQGPGPADWPERVRQALDTMRADLEQARG
jgi:orotidine-5'-phosphate decarboxylase